MDLRTFDEFRKQFHKDMESIVAVKNPDYSVNADTMSNYKEIARFLGIPPRVVWAVLFMKHVTAISRYVRDGRVSSEPIRGRFLDAANYCVLGSALISEEDDTADPTPIATAIQEFEAEYQRQHAEPPAVDHPWDAATFLTFVGQNPARFGGLKNISHGMAVTAAFAESGDVVMGRANEFIRGFIGKQGAITTSCKWHSFLSLVSKSIS